VVVFLEQLDLCQRIVFPDPRPNQGSDLLRNFAFLPLTYMPPVCKRLQPCFLKRYNKFTTVLLGISIDAPNSMASAEERSSRMLQSGPISLHTSIAAEDVFWGLDPQAPHSSVAFEAFLQKYTLLAILQKHQPPTQRPRSSPLEK